MLGVLWIRSSNSGMAASFVRASGGMSATAELLVMIDRVVRMLEAQ